MIDNKARERVDQFILEQIESVPHLEALLLVWNRRPHEWSAGEMAAALYIVPEEADKILQELVQRDLIASHTDANGVSHFLYGPQSEANDKLLQDLDLIYRRELVRVARMIHSKASPAVRDFARAFRFKKD
jgi:predicted ArsR family transcriptional regulator